MIDLVGLQVYTLRDALAEDFPGTLERVAQIGYDEVELYDLLGHDASQVASWAADVGLMTPSIMTLRRPLIEQPERLIEECWTLGCRYLSLTYLLPEERETLDQFQRLAADLNRVGELCSGAGVQLAYHNHDFEFVPKDGVLPYDLLLAETDPALVALELDLYWVEKAGDSAEDRLADSPGRFPLIHVKDMADSAEREFTELGTGTLDFLSLLTAAVEAGAHHFFVEQDVIAGDPWQSVATSLAYLRRLEL